MKSKLALIALSLFAANHIDATHLRNKTRANRMLSRHLAKTNRYHDTTLRGAALDAYNQLTDGSWNNKSGELDIAAFRNYGHLKGLHPTDITKAIITFCKKSES